MTAMILLPGNTRVSPNPPRDRSPKTPVSLLQRLRHPGDEEAWTRFVILYTPLLESWSRRAGLQEADAADLVQSVFMRLAKELPRFHYDPTLRFRGWLRTVTMNLLRDRKRAKPMVEGGGPADAATAADGIAILIDREYTAWLVGRAPPG